MQIKEPMEIDYENDSIDQIIEKIEFAIEQHPSFLKVIPQELLLAYEEQNQQRRWRSHLKDKKKENRG
jgi:lipopolysaccharide biosynthesis regulator YciM